MLCFLGCSVKAGLLVLAKIAKQRSRQWRTSSNVFYFLIADPVVYSPTRTCYDALAGPNSDVNILIYV